MDDRIVKVRTSESAGDFWSRLRVSTDIHANFNVRSKKEDEFATRIRSETPFGRQEAPRFCYGLRSSRSIERAELLHAIREVEKENSVLHKQKKMLRSNLNRALKINNALTSNMLCKTLEDDG